MRKPVITQDTPAIRELFTDRKNILLCNVADAEDLAEKIRLLYADATLRAQIATGGYEVYQTHGTPKIVGAQLLKKFTSLT